MSLKRQTAGCNLAIASEFLFLFMGPAAPGFGLIPVSHTRCRQALLVITRVLEGARPEPNPCAPSFSFIALLPLVKGRSNQKAPNKGEKIVEQNDQIQGKIPLDLKAVLTIFNADLELQIETLPHVKIHAGEIDWPSIFKNDFGSGHRAAIVWAKSLWTCHGPSRVDAFDRAFAMDNHLRQAVVQAISIRWGLSN